MTNTVGKKNENQKRRSEVTDFRKRKEFVFISRTVDIISRMT